MKNKVVVQICDIEYSLLTEETEEYVRSLANEITQMVENTVYKNLRTSKTDAAMITCLELCDKIHKLSQDNENMSRKIMEYVEEIGELSKKITTLERQKSAKAIETIDSDADDTDDSDKTSESTEMQEDLA